MKKTHFIELLKNIKVTRVGFISIALFVALSTGIYSGLSWVSETIKISTMQNFNENKLHDSEIMFSYGYSDNDIKELNKDNENLIVEGNYFCYENFVHDNQRFQAIVLGVGEEVDKPIIKSGQLPSNNNEIAIDYLFSFQHDLNIGDVVKFEKDDASASYKINKLLSVDLDNFNSDDLNLDKEVSYFNNNEFVVSGIVASPRYLMLDTQYYGFSLTNNTKVDCFFYVNKDAFNKEAFNGYVDVNVYNKELSNISYFSDEYKTKADSFNSDILDKASQLSKEKYNTITGKIKEIDDYINNKLSDANKQIEDGEQELKKGKKQLAQLKTQLDDGKAQLNGANAALSSYEKSFNDLKATYIEAKNKQTEFLDFDSYFTYLEENGIIESLQDMVFEYGGQEKLDEFNQEYAQVKAYPDSLIGGWFEKIDGYFNLGQTILSNKRNEFNTAYALYEDGLKQYNKGTKLLKESEKKLAQAKLDYEQGLNDYNLYKQQTANIPTIPATSISRSQNACVITTETMCKMYEKLRYSMAALFVVVGLLVCYSAISRTVNDQVKAIGTKKALGFNQAEITTYYLYYTTLTLIIGCILGAAIGYFVVESVFLPVLNNYFAVPLTKYFDIKNISGVAILEAVLLISTTYFACRSILKQNAIKLLGGNISSNGKQHFYEKFKIWDKLSLLTQTIINNSFTDRRRVLGTIIGVAGCTALLVTALTFNNNALGSLDAQYNESFFFDTFIDYVEKENTIEQIEAVLNKHDLVGSRIFKDKAYIKCPDQSISITNFFVAQDKESFYKLVKLNPYKSNNKDTTQGLWVGSSYANYFDHKENEEINFIDVNGQQFKVVPNGFFYNYLTNHITIMDSETFKEQFGKTNKANSFIVDRKDVDIETLNNELKQIDGYVGIEDYYQASSHAFKIFASLSKVMVFVYIGLSIVMAFLVLYNLLSMFVDEKKTELIVLMINGFYLKDAKRYIYSDTILLTIIGVVLGEIAGSYVGNVSISAFDTSATMLLQRVDLFACLIGAIGTVVLTIIVSLLALSKIKKFKLTDINKS